LKWLKELVPVDLGVNDLVDRLDMTGTAVEAVHTTGDSFDNVVVGLITAKEKHPQADKLWVTVVDVGDSTMRTIVCGAQNFEAGDKVPVALPGAVLPGGFEIKKAKLRGVLSEGMNCSARELGIGEDHEGLMILPADAPVGAKFAEWYGLSDTVIELEVTPNRPDCLSMVGVAREVGAVTEREYAKPSQVPAEAGTLVSEACAITVEDSDLCPRYTARLIKGVKVGPSPQWLAEKVTAAGARPINNIVDVTNYVMFELGQPLHAFDMNTLAKDQDGKVQIVVRLAREGERLVTLDGVDRALTPETLVIADVDGAIALAGVMGGESTEVSDITVDVLLESASFDPVSVSRTSRSLGLISEASMRYERTVDRTGCVEASDRAAALIAEIAGGEVAPGILDVFGLPLAPRSLTLRQGRVEQILGVDVPAEDVISILERLGCGVERKHDSFEVSVPTFRPDLEREVDLIEEVLRIWGMDRIAATLPGGRERVGHLTRDQRWRERVGETLRASGLNETMTYAFTDPSDLDRLDMRLPDDEILVELLNPMSEEQSVLRRTLLPGLLRSVSFNQRRGVPDVQLYEIGSVYWTGEGRKQPKERPMAAAVLAGAWNVPGWNQPRVPLDFFDGKGILEVLVRELGIERFKVRSAELAWLQPGRAAEVIVAGEVLGWIGEVHPSALARFECEAPLVAFELDLHRLTRAAREDRKLVEPPRFPPVELDIAIVVAESVTAEKIEQAIRSAGGRLLEDLRLFDVYRGKGVESGKKSMAYALTYRLADRTLTAEEVDAAHEKLLRKVLAATGGELRG
jgi:phenylalanyl-tRNA synthetase beta chain